MRKIFFFSIIVIIFQLFSCNDDPFDPIVFGTIEGVVVDDINQIGIEGVLVSTAPVSSSVLTDVEGKFILESVPTGEYDVLFEKSNFVTERETILVNEDETTEITVLITEKASTNTSPELPSNEAPIHLTEELDLDVRLSWTSSDSNVEDSIRYDVILYSSQNPQLQQILTNAQDTFVQLTNLSYGTTYFWQVIVDDNVNTPVYGPIWQFTTKVFPDNPILFVRRINGIYQIFSGDETGQETQLTFSSNNVWRPRYNFDRSKIAFISQDGIEKHLFLMNPDGSEIQKVTSTVPLNSFDEDFSGFCWSPNGAYLVYMNYNQLLKIQIDGTGLEVLSEIDNNLSFNYCDWTDDPQTQFVVRTSTLDKYNSNIYIMDENGNFTNHIFQNIDGRTGGGAFSVDGLSVLFSHDFSGFEGQNGRQLDAKIYLIDLNTNNLNNISLSKPQGSNDLDPRFSPNGADIIFTNSSNALNSVKDIYKMNLVGERELLFPNAEMPDWK